MARTRSQWGTTRSSKATWRISPWLKGAIMSRRCQPLEPDRATEDGVRIRIRVAQQHVAGLWSDRVALRPLVVHDPVSGLEAPPQLPSDRVWRGDAIAVRIDEVYALRPAGGRASRAGHGGHVDDGASAGPRGSRLRKRRTYQTSGIRMKKSCEITLP